MAIEWLICREPVHIGGVDSSSRGNNNPIFRLSDRTPAIPGSSLRGALREGAKNQANYQALVKNWFGGEDSDISPGYISLGWGWPVWWPVHVLGYGNWWVSCPTWLNRFRQLSGQPAINAATDKVYITEPELKNKTVYLRWIKLTNVQHYQGDLPAPADVPKDRRIILPDPRINLIVDMGLVRQPRVSLNDEPDQRGNLVNHLFSVEGFPPGAVFLITWTTRGDVQDLPKWNQFLIGGEHYLGGLWSVGYGRISIAHIN
ncbi:RAMP superfamily CRISPR-associated protein [Microseira sp. BLCC-F43]|jgi:CRISPR/Cas system CMR subunit Cmr4 (Cas7 group RAMP superfamily)|uniref:RAMP superfamily CRISPR-associated protein n=1 Tax=Microseira sp. BLCC-F43 TaxID=3153602 RepID=UPI0035B84B51